MIIDTERLRGALDRQVEAERESIFQSYSQPGDAIERLQEHRQAAEELVNAVEELAREYIEGRTP
jgi:hypothetical protein